MEAAGVELEVAVQQLPKVSKEARRCKTQGKITAEG